MSLPEIATIIGTVIAAASLLAGMYKWAHAKGVKEGRTENINARDLDSLNQLYAPLVLLFLDVHLLSSTLTKYPTFRHRFKHAVCVFQERRSIKSKLRGAFNALFDKGVSEPLVDLEYGSMFPTKGIRDLLKKKPHLAHPVLIDLYRSLTKDEHERGSMHEWELSAIHLELLQHVFTEHKRLTTQIRSGR